MSKFNWATSIIITAVSVLFMCPAEAINSPNLDSKSSSPELYEHDLQKKSINLIKSDSLTLSSKGTFHNFDESLESCSPSIIENAGSGWKKELVEVFANSKAKKACEKKAEEIKLKDHICEIKCEHYVPSYLCEWTLGAIKQRTLPKFGYKLSEYKYSEKWPEDDIPFYSLGNGLFQFHGFVGDLKNTALRINGEIAKSKGERILKTIDNQYITFESFYEHYSGHIFFSANLREQTGKWIEELKLIDEHQSTFNDPVIVQSRDNSSVLMSNDGVNFSIIYKDLSLKKIQLNSFAPKYLVDIVPGFYGSNYVISRGDTISLISDQGLVSESKVLQEPFGSALKTISYVGSTSDKSIYWVIGNRTYNENLKSFGLLTLDQKNNFVYHDLSEQLKTEDIYSFETLPVAISSDSKRGLESMTFMKRSSSDFRLVTFMLDENLNVANVIKTPSYKYGNDEGMLSTGNFVDVIAMADKKWFRIFGKNGLLDTIPFEYTGKSGAWVEFVNDESNGFFGINANGYDGYFKPLKIELIREGCYYE